LEVASSLYSMGLVSYKLRMIPMALESFTQSLKVQRQHFGDAHPEIAVNLYNIATIQFEIGNDEVAMRYYKETLCVERTIYGPDHTDTIPTLQLLGKLHQQRGESHDAIHYYQEVLRIQRPTMSMLPDDLSKGTVVATTQYDNNQFQLRPRQHLSNSDVMSQTLHVMGTLYLQTGNAGGFVNAMSESWRLSRAAAQEQQRPAAAAAQQQQGQIHTASNCHSTNTDIPVDNGDMNDTLFPPTSSPTGIHHHHHDDHHQYEMIPYTATLTFPFVLCDECKKSFHLYVLSKLHPEAASVA
jgi:tetratricopeptide (TPR) repeat protein